MPHWHDAGIDTVHGGFFERLNFSGTADTVAYKRLRVQARQIYVFAQAALIDPETLRRPLWRAAAAQGFDFLQNYWLGNDRGWAQSVTVQGAPNDTAADTYDQAFVLLAAAWYLRATNDAKAQEIIARTLRFLDTRLACVTHGGYFEGLADTGELLAGPARRQNPHMHLLEAMLALYQATGDQDYLNRSRRLYELFRIRFFDSETGTLGEYFSVDWKILPGKQGQCVEPGHHFEWVWLLHAYAGLAGDATARDCAGALFEFATDHGIHPVSRLVYDELNRSGVIIRGSHRLWPQTEALKAFIATAEYGPDAGARDAARQCISPAVDAIFDHYILPGSGIWNDQLNPKRQRVSNFVPATSLYHLFLAFSEALRFYDANKSI